MLAAAALQIPTVGVPAQHADSQSALEMQPPVVNCNPLPLPTSLAPALLGVRARVETATGGVLEGCGGGIGGYRGGGEKGMEGDM